jgi:hypothetical protein
VVGAGEEASRLAGYDDPAAIDPAYDLFLRLFNSGQFWDSHEALEARWREDGSEFYHGLILLASAFVHVNRGNRHGIAAQLGKARPFLESRAPHYLGLDVNRILDHAATCRQIVAEHPDAPPHAWPVLVPFPRLEFDPALVRGDEFELPGADPHD